MADDDPGMLRAMSELLELEGYTVATCANGRDAIRSFETLQPNIVILDVRMPEMDGLAACRIIRSRSDVPIVMLTVMDDEWDAAHALESGADDYIRIPVGAAEFVARIRAALRRPTLVNEDVAGPITIGHLTIDVLEHQVHADGQLVELSPIELRLLTHLAKSQNHVLTHDDALAAVWGPGYSGSRHVLRVTMSRLRQKLAMSDCGDVSILTFEGVGYRLMVRESALAPIAVHHEL
jgi:DNA-binding response OmpR family regulator